MNGRAWESWERSMLRTQYPHMATTVIAVMIGRPVNRIYAMAAIMGLHKTEEYLASPAACRLRRGGDVGAAYRYPKGHVPANKGSRRPGWHAGRMKTTQFRKGQVNGQAARHLMPIGTTRLIDGYIYLKVADVMGVPYTANWKPLHILNWERANGRMLPRSHCLFFKDGNRQNVDLDNLELITRAENMRRNTIHRLPKPLKEVIQLRGALLRQIHRKEGKHGEQDRGPEGPPLRDARGAAQPGPADGHRPRKGRGRGREGDRGQRKGRVRAHEADGRGWEWLYPGRKGGPRDS